MTSIIQPSKSQRIGAPTLTPTKISHDVRVPSSYIQKKNSQKIRQTTSTYQSVMKLQMSALSSIILFQFWGYDGFRSFYPPLWSSSELFGAQLNAPACTLRQRDQKSEILHINSSITKSLRSKSSPEHVKAPIRSVNPNLLPNLHVSSI